MHRQATLPRTANLLGALALEATGALSAATGSVVGRSGAAAAALVVVAARPGCSIEYLRAPLGLSQPGAVRLVEHLADQGWIERGGPGGRRGLQLRLTDEGREVFERLVAARRAALVALLEPLPEEDRARLAELLERLLAAQVGEWPDLERLCRLCERRVCAQCPVARAFEAIPGAERPWPPDRA
jgi:DNA-binding MarR family transcriptional regulator